MTACVLCNGTATTEVYTYGHTLSLHDSLPISRVIGPSGAVVPDLSCLRSTVSHHRGHLVNCRGAGSSTRSRRRSRASMSALFETSMLAVSRIVACPVILYRA